MKITAQEEYGMRILVRIAACKSADGLSIPQISEAEGLTSPYVAKLTRLLRIAGFIKSTPGTKGGYILARPSQDIIINDVLKELGGSLFDVDFCGAHSNAVKLCNHSVDCSTRSLWKMIQYTMDELLNKVTLFHLVNPERESARLLEDILFKRTIAQPAVSVNAEAPLTPAQ